MRGSCPMRWMFRQSGTTAAKPCSTGSRPPYFSASESKRSTRYRLRVRFANARSNWTIRTGFRRSCPTYDLHLLGEGNHLQLYDKLGAHPIELDGVPGVAFAVFAPNARRVSVVGDFNSWDGRRHAMRVRGNGFWEIFVPGSQRRRQVQIRNPRRTTATCCRSNPIRSHLPRRSGRKTASIVVDPQTISGRAPAPRAATRWTHRSRSMKCISAPGGGGPRRAPAG